MEQTSKQIGTKKEEVMSKKRMPGRPINPQSKRQKKKHLKKSGMISDNKPQLHLSNNNLNPIQTQLGALQIESIKTEDPGETHNAKAERGIVAFNYTFDE